MNKKKKNKIKEGKNKEKIEKIGTENNLVDALGCVPGAVPIDQAQGLAGRQTEESTGVRKIGVRQDTD
jgi:hypothetical protein